MNEDLLRRVAQIIMCTSDDVVEETAMEAARDIIHEIEQN